MHPPFSQINRSAGQRTSERAGPQPVGLLEVIKNRKNHQFLLTDSLAVVYAINGCQVCTQAINGYNRQKFSVGSGSLPGLRKLEAEHVRDINT